MQASIKLAHDGNHQEDFRITEPGIRQSKTERRLEINTPYVQNMSMSSQPKDKTGPGGHDPANEGGVTRADTSSSSAPVDVSPDKGHSAEWSQAWARENASAIGERRRWIDENGAPLSDLQVLELGRTS